MVGGGELLAWHTQSRAWMVLRLGCRQATPDFLFYYCKQEGSQDFFFEDGLFEPNPPLVGPCRDSSFLELDLGPVL